MKFALSVFITVLYLSLVIGHWSLIYATYVLPYPSYMPGNKMYKVSRIADQLKKFWYWGNIAKTKYYLGLSDKYLVEAKTLFEYNQYLLATEALARSNKMFTQIFPYIAQAKAEKKDISLLRTIVTEEVKAHENILEIVKGSVPERTTWSPERSKPTELALRDLLNSSIQLREHILSEILSL